MNFWDENVYIDINTNELVADVDRETNDIQTKVDGLDKGVAVNFRLDIICFSVNICY